MTSGTRMTGPPTQSAATSGDLFDRAWALITSVKAFGPDEWLEVYRRARAIDNGLHLNAVRQLGEAMSCHPQSRALSALATAAREVPGTSIANRAAIRASARTSAARPTRNVSREALDYAGRATRYAALALALAPKLEVRHVALLVMPVFAVLHRGDDGAPLPSQ